MRKGEAEAVVIAVITRDGSVAERARHMLSLWSKALCVNYLLIDWNGKDAWFPDPSPDVLFLDLQGEDGDLSREPDWLADLPSACALVILSDDQRQAIQAYQWHPAACLAPDYSYDALCRTMDRCFCFWRQGLEWIDLPCQWDRVRIPLSRIQYAESMGRDTILHCTDGEIRVNLPLSKLEPELLSPPFIRCQKSFLIHPDAVDALAGGELYMKDRQILSISRNRRKEVHDLLVQWWSDRGRTL